jgi:hypothetical protein
MSSEITVELENRPGTLAQLGEALGQAGVNIQGISGFTAGGGPAVLHVLVADPDAARKALQAARIPVRGDRPVLVRQLQDRPGELGKLCRSLAAAGVNVEFIYQGTNNQVVLGVSDLKKAETAV